MPQVAQIAQITPSANYGMVDNSNNTGEINGKTCSIIKSNDNGVTNLARNRVDHFRENATSYLDKMKNYCQTKLPESMRNSFFKHSAYNNTDVKKIEREKRELSQNLSDLIKFHHNDYKSKGQLHVKLLNQLKGIDNQLTAQTADINSVIKDTVKESLLYNVIKDMHDYDRDAFYNYFTEDRDGINFLSENSKKSEVDTLKLLLKASAEVIVNKMQIEADKKKKNNIN